MVNCGATPHMITNKESFKNLEESFNPDEHYIELADDTRTPGVVRGKGTATVDVHDASGNECKLLLNNALYVPTFKQNIFSVHAATEKGAVLNFERNTACLESSDGTKFPIETYGKLYYLNSLSCINKNVSRSAEEWHKVLGHCNYESLFKLPNVVKGMKITDKTTPQCETCIKGKMTKSFSKIADVKASKPP